MRCLSTLLGLLLGLALAEKQCHIFEDLTQTNALRVQRGLGELKAFMVPMRDGVKL